MRRIARLTASKVSTQLHSASKLTREEYTVSAVPDSVSAKRHTKAAASTPSTNSAAVNQRWLPLLARRIRPIPPPLEWGREVGRSGTGCQAACMKPLSLWLAAAAAPPPPPLRAALRSGGGRGWRHNGCNAAPAGIVVGAAAHPSAAVKRSPRPARLNGFSVAPAPPTAPHKRTGCIHELAAQEARSEAP